MSGCRGNVGARGAEGISGGKGFVLCPPWSNWLCPGVHSDSDKGGLVCSAEQAFRLSRNSCLLGMENAAAFEVSHSPPLTSFLCLKCIKLWGKIRLFPPGFEPGTFRVLGERDNHYTTETTRVSISNDIPKNSMFDHNGHQKFSMEHVVQIYMLQCWRAETHLNLHIGPLGVTACAVSPFVSSFH